MVEIRKHRIELGPLHNLLNLSIERQLEEPKVEREKPKRHAKPPRRKRREVENTEKCCGNPASQKRRTEKESPSIETLARSEYNMVKPGEIEFRFTNDN